MRAASTFEGRVTLELLVNLLARFYPRLGILSSDAETDRLRRGLCEQAVAINPQIELTLESDKLAAVVSVGTAVAPAGVRAIYVGSRGWTMHISPDAPVGCGDSPNPFAAAAAACFGAANVFRVDLTGERPNCYYEAGYARGLDKRIVLSVRKDSRIHFDLAGFRFIIWADGAELAKQLRERFAEMKKLDEA